MIVKTIVYGRDRGQSASDHNRDLIPDSATLFHICNNQDHKEEAQDQRCKQGDITPQDGPAQQTGTS